ncbi:hypothetical protein J3R82DRAFT_5815 [Butyriboletus roseoflavus]|nr:hypothetical protein J3R82DRAFT_5815 [Butyriboletus roseoflavus]
MCPSSHTAARRTGVLCRHHPRDRIGRTVDGKANTGGIFYGRLGSHDHGARGRTRRRCAHRWAQPSRSSSGQVHSQVVSVGALDMVNFGPASTVPAKFSGRRFARHNASVTLMRTSPEECRVLGETIAQKLGKALPDRTHVLLPLRGFSGIGKDGGPFWDVEADMALLDTLRSAGLECPVEELDTDINDPSFSIAAVSALHRMIQSMDKHI